MSSFRVLAAAAVLSATALGTTGANAIGPHFGTGSAAGGGFRPSVGPHFGNGGGGGVRPPVGPHFGNGGGGNVRPPVGPHFGGGTRPAVGPHIGGFGNALGGAVVFR